MGLYCGVDLHPNNHVVTVIDEADRRLYEKRHPNELASTLGVLERFRGELAGGGYRELSGALRSQELSTPALAHERRVTDFDPDGCMVRIDLSMQPA